MNRSETPPDSTDLSESHLPLVIGHSDQDNWLPWLQPSPKTISELWQPAAKRPSEMKAGDASDSTKKMEFLRSV